MTAFLLLFRLWCKYW